MLQVSQLGARNDPPSLLQCNETFFNIPPQDHSGDLHNNTIQSSPLQCSTLHSSTLHNNTIQSSTIQCSSLHSSTLGTLIREEIQSVLSAASSAKESDQSALIHSPYARKYSDLNYLSPVALAKWLQLKVPNLLVIDCRYPYEYEGGHIEGAVNLHTEQMIEDCLLASPMLKSPIIVLHCEFSSCRGPSRYRYLRQQDRKLNMMKYPHLFYPHIYLLEGGYRQFFITYPTLCIGGYIEMANKLYKDQKKAHKSKREKKWCNIAE